MLGSADLPLIGRRYGEAYGACPSYNFDDFLLHGSPVRGGAVLGYRRADKGPLFLETYLDHPIEDAVSHAFAMPVGRSGIVEIGNLASDNALATIRLWAMAANDLGGSCEIAVATLTAPLRAMFRRIGLPIVVLETAQAERLGEKAAEWGSYYADDPQVCAGMISRGQEAIGAFMARRMRKAAA